MSSRTLAQLAEYPVASAEPAKRAPLTPEQSEKLQNLIDHFNHPEFQLPHTLKTLKAIHKQRAGGSTAKIHGWLRGPTDLQVRHSNTELTQRS